MEANYLGVFNSRLLTYTREQQKHIADGTWTAFSSDSVEAALKDFSETPVFGNIFDEAAQIRRSGRHPVDPIEQYQRRLGFAIFYGLAHNFRTWQNLSTNLTTLTFNQTTDSLGLIRIDTQRVRHMFDFISIEGPGRLPHAVEIRLEGGLNPVIANCCVYINIQGSSIRKAEPLNRKGRYFRRLARQNPRILSRSAFKAIVPSAEDDEIHSSDDLMIVRLPYTKDEFSQAKERFLDRHSLRR